ncbi:MAG: hypothetical protein R2991_06230 [Thermoanaerobaculia bacterium]
MIRFLMALLVAMAPMVFGATSTVRNDGGPHIDGNDEWLCDGNLSENCNPAR